MKKKNVRKCEPDKRYAIERAEKLIHILTGQRVSPELKKRLQDWFISDANEEAKQKAFVDYSESVAPQERSPSRKARKRFVRLAGKLGLPAGGKFLGQNRADSKNKWVWRVTSTVMPFWGVFTGS